LKEKGDSSKRIRKVETDKKGLKRKLHEGKTALKGEAQKRRKALIGGSTQ
jgi:hypothetical protein